MTKLEEYFSHYYIFPFLEQVPSGGQVYEFGTYGGLSLLCLLKELIRLQLKVDNVYCFDSFIGLPQEIPDIPKHNEWFEGNFNALELYDVKTPEEVIILIKERIKEFDYNVNFIPGWFKDTLNLETIQKYSMQPASYVNIDVDLYSSTLEVLEFLFYYKLIQVGTIIRYDDWLSQQYSNGDLGESKAHYELTSKYNIKMHRYQPHKKMSPIFMVE